MSQEKVFRLDRFEAQWAEIKRLHREATAAKKRLDEYKGLLKEVAGEAKEFTIKGHTVATLVPGQLNKSQLAQEQPDLVDEYTELVTKKQFNQERFAKELPEVFERYRVQRLVFVGDDTDD